MTEHPLDAAILALRSLGTEWVHRYHRLDLQGDLTAPSEPVLFVANHGFGGVFDVNVLAVLAALDQMQLDRPVTILTHQIAWTLGVGRILEPFGARPACRSVAAESLAAGQHVLVFPGGDLDAFKARSDENKIVFGGRAGFASLAHEADVPIRPIVTAGAGRTLFVLSDGAKLARALRLDQALRLKALPVSLSIPWGLNIGLVGLLPYLPLPARLATEVLPPVFPMSDESAAQLAEHVRDQMQNSLTRLAAQLHPWGEED
ncbi:1-acyl-sn-glycerol-3-phosphate acyltransferase [Gordonia sp. FQ]|uniref:1-acyl-sn-glycerol-3-phosphate acyltransferase n=1 Tax=Gordonia sp. FQ TaxID=3446634 RepID=UPI003F87F9FB